MALTRGARPGDFLVAAYNLLLGAIWWANWRQAPHAPWIAIAHLAAAGLPWLIARAPRRRWDFMAALREIYPLLLLLPFWTELDLLRDVLGYHGYDAQIQALDRAVFGVHLHAVWLPRMDALWVSEPLFFMYYAYYALIFLPPLVLAFRGHRGALRDVTLRLMATYLTCYVVYLAFPVYGPHFLEPHHQGPHTAGFFYNLVAAAQAAGDSHGCAFPSSHVAGAVTIALVAWRWFPRGLAVVLSLEALGVVLSTVYTQNHYGIDSLFGIGWAFTIQLGVVPAGAYLLGPARARRTPPVPPELAPALRTSDSLGGVP
ncbi:MAG: phosphatase PAP2 family protein [Gemmatimonadetes bacterium]|nr:phosphatase PAP2 family protein [Gemmatimonadota bacterium]